MKFEATSNSDEKTRKIGQALGALIDSRIVVALSGDLAAGKTTLVKGMARGLGVPEDYHITSPTYTIINEYPGRIPLVHMDLYRLGEAEELDYLGFDEIAESRSAIVVEWPGLMGRERVHVDIAIAIQTDSAFNRRISVIGSGLTGKNLLNPDIKQTQAIKPPSEPESTVTIRSYKKGISLKLGLKINLN